MLMWVGWGWIIDIWHASIYGWMWSFKIYAWCLSPCSFCSQFDLQHLHALFDPVSQARPMRLSLITGCVYWNTKSEDLGECRLFCWLEDTVALSTAFYRVSFSLVPRPLAKDYQVTRLGLFVSLYNSINNTLLLMSQTICIFRCWHELSIAIRYQT